MQTWMVLVGAAPPNVLPNQVKQIDKTLNVAVLGDHHVETMAQIEACTTRCTGDQRSQKRGSRPGNRRVPASSFTSKASTAAASISGSELTAGMLMWATCCTWQSLTSARRVARVCQWRSFFQMRGRFWDWSNRLETGLKTCCLSIYPCHFLNGMFSFASALTESLCLLLGQFVLAGDRV